jgi:hypothetical protein
MLLQSLCQLKKMISRVSDLVKNEAIVWHDDTQGATFDVVAIPRKCLMKLKNTDHSY